MKYGYPELMKECKCETCIGCNSLELIFFRGTYICQDYIRGKDEQKDDNRGTINRNTEFV